MPEHHAEKPAPPTPDPPWSVFAFVGACEAVGFASSRLAGVGKRTPWIDDTAKPRLWPASWVFPAAWAVLNYPSLGIATWLVWRRRRQTRNSGAMRWFAAQLIFNAAFLPTVYRARTRSTYVTMDAVGVLLTALTLRSYGRVSPAAGLALAPYAIWTVYTTAIKALWWRKGRGREPTAGRTAPRVVDFTR